MILMGLHISPDICRLFQKYIYSAAMNENRNEDLNIYEHVFKKDVAPVRESSGIMFKLALMHTNILYSLANSYIP